MNEKKSLQEAIQKAQNMSTEHPNITYYVIDKKYKTTVVLSLEFAVREKILSGWHCVCRFKNGQKMR